MYGEGVDEGGRGIGDEIVDVDVGVFTSNGNVLWLINVSGWTPDGFDTTADGCHGELGKELHFWMCLESIHKRTAIERLILPTGPF